MHFRFSVFGASFAVLQFQLATEDSDHKKGLKRWLDAVMHGEISRLVIPHQDRLLHFGGQPVLAVCAARNVEVSSSRRDGSDSLARFNIRGILGSEGTRKDRPDGP